MYLNVNILQLDYYFSEALAELRAAAGITAVEISAQNDTVGKSGLGGPFRKSAVTLDKSLYILQRAYK